MEVMLSMSRQDYSFVKSRLFKDHKEQGVFLFTDTHFTGAVVQLCVKKVHEIKEEGWDHRSEYHLELKEEEKVKVMLAAKKHNYDLLECHSHCAAEIAQFSHSDTSGLNEFIRYVWWKLPGKIYGALVWAENDIAGQVWLPKNSIPAPITEIRIIS